MKRQVKDYPVLTTAPELRDSLLDLIRAKFYQGHQVEFAKDRPRLISWVVLYPATWLHSRGVTLPPDRFRQILSAVLVEAASFCEPSKVTYLPAYLRQVIQSHFRIHGEDYYDEAKAIRNRVDRVLMVTGRAQVVQPDPVRGLAQAAAAVRLLKAQKRPVKAPLTRQLDLL
jgi:hypothetical protein